MRQLLSKIYSVLIGIRFDSAEEELRTDCHALINAVELEPRVLYSAAPMDLAGLDEAVADLTVGGLNHPAQFGNSETDGLVNQSLDRNSQFSEFRNPLLPDYFSPHRLTVTDGEQVQLVFIDTGVENWGQLYNEMQRDLGFQSGTEFILLDSDSDGIEQITKSLANPSEA